MTEAQLPGLLFMRLFRTFLFSLETDVFHSEWQVAGRIYILFL